MKKDYGFRAERAICEAIGIDPNYVQRVAIYLELDEIPEVRVTALIPDGEALVEAVQRFHIVPAADWPAPTIKTMADVSFPVGSTAVVET
jgi:hypothetical protein